MLIDTWSSYPFSCRASSIILIQITVSGCAVTGSQRLTLACSFEEKKPYASKLSEAAQCTNDLVIRLQERLAQHDKTINLSRLGVLGGTLGSGLAAIYSAPRDVIVGLGVVGAGSYIAGNLYAPPAYQTIYAAGLDAAVCTNNVSRKAAGSAEAIRSSRDALAASFQTLRKTLSGSSPSTVGGDVYGKATNAVNQAEKSQHVARGVLAQEPHFANGLVNVAFDIGSAIDQQVMANTPRLEAFYDASRQAISLGQSLVPAAVPAGDTPQAPPGASSGPPGTSSTALRIDESLKQKLEDETYVVSDNRARLDTVLAAFGAPDASACAARAKSVTITPLTLRPAVEEVPISSGTTFTLVAIGGQSPYQGSWIGVEPAASQFIVTKDRDSFRFDAKATLSRPFTYLIRDATGVEKKVMFSPK